MGGLEKRKIEKSLRNEEKINQKSYCFLRKKMSTVKNAKDFKENKQTIRTLV